MYIYNSTFFTLTFHSSRKKVLLRAVRYTSADNAENRALNSHVYGTLNAQHEWAGAVPYTQF